MSRATETRHVSLKRDAKRARVAAAEQRDFDRIRHALALAGVPHDATEAADACEIRLGTTWLHFTGWAHRTHRGQFRDVSYFVQR